VGVGLIFSDAIQSQIRKRKTLPIAQSSSEEISRPERGNYYRSTSVSHDNPDGSITFQATIERQIDRRRQMWESLASRFKMLEQSSAPPYAQWTYTTAVVTTTSLT
jgi:hypothetical protein